MNQTVVIGLDGANWGLIEGWLKNGDLENINRIKNEGAYSISKSELPPVTCPNWKCYSTSKNPGELGVFWWEHIDMATQNISFPDANSFHTAEIWDYLGDAGLSWVAINMPLTYPPREIPKGDVIAGGPLCANNGYTSDPDIESELENRFEYRVRPRLSLTSTKKSSEEVEEILSLIDTRFDVLEWYIKEKEVEFAHLTLFLLNLLQHYFWKGKPTKRAWELIDRRIGRVLADDRNIILMSDHGCSDIDTVFHINQWLDKIGYLEVNRGVSDTFQTIGITKERVKSVVDTLGLGKVARRLPASVKNTLPQQGEGTKRQGKIRRVDWNQSKALASGQGPVYVRDNTAVSELISQIIKVKTPEKKNIAKEVLTKEEAYKGRFIQNAPDIVIEQAEGIHIADGIGTQDVFTQPSRWKADNNRDGLFAAYGPDIRDENLGYTSILDIAPTILQMNTGEVPADMEGEVLDIFTSESDIIIKNIKKIKPIKIDTKKTGDSGAVEERLRDLGYLTQ